MFVMQGLSALGEGKKQQLTAFISAYIYLYAEWQGYGVGDTIQVSFPIYSTQSQELSNSLI